MDIRTYQPADTPAILALFEQAFRRPMSADVWKWRYLANPSAEAPQILLAWDGDTLAGHYAVSPQPLRIEGDVCMAALSMTTMTHPAYEGRGLFTLLARQLYAALEEDHGYFAVYGFPNANSHYGFIRKLGWNDITTVPTLSVAGAAFLERRIPGTGTHQVGTHFHEAHLAALTAFTGSFAVSVAKTTQWLTWRYLHNPSARYDLHEWPMPQDSAVPFMVAKAFPSFSIPNTLELDLLELGLTDTEALPSFLADVLHWYQQQGKAIARINLWLPLYHPFHIAFERLGFTAGGHTTYFGIRPAHQQSSRLLTDPRAWYLNYGMSDVY